MRGFVDRWLGNRALLGAGAIVLLMGFTAVCLAVSVVVVVGALLVELARSLV